MLNSNKIERGKIKMIKEKVYYFIKLKTDSPLSIGNGIEEITDNDILRDSEGKPFIPATSLAGVMLHYLDKDEQKIFIPSRNSDSMLSPYFISDAELVKSSGISIRDGIKVDIDKVTVDGAKYNVEILEAGAEFEFRVEITIRDNDDQDKMKEIMDKIFVNINAGNILIGSKSTRGFGKIHIIECYKKEFNQKNLPELVDFNKFNCNEYEKYEFKTKNINEKYDTIKVSLKQLGGLNIRSYSAKADDVDYRTIRSNEVPVIPGTSWNGVLRRQVSYYNSRLEEKNYKYNIDEWFGYADEKESRASSIIIEESRIENYKTFRLTRNKIDRFSGGSADSALFNEELVFNGETLLTIKIKKELNGKDNSYILGLFALVIKDIANGLLAVGGQTAIGRGILEVKKIQINNEFINLNKSEENIKSLDDYIFKMYEVARNLKEE